MIIDWSKVLESHIEEACRQHDEEDNHPTSRARTTFLIHNGKQYPAKFIRGLAYEIATGDKLGSNNYSGGLETVRFLSALGFSVKHNGRIIDGVHKHIPDQKTTIQNSIDQEPTNQKPIDSESTDQVSIEKVSDTMNSSSKKTQKDFLIKLLKQRFGCVLTETKFDWLKVPDRVSKDGVLDGIYENLVLIRGCKYFPTPGYCPIGAQGR